MHTYAKVLWDIDPNQMDSLSESFVIRRVLSYGGVGLVFQVIHSCGIDAVRNEFFHMKDTSMHSKRYQYLKEFVLS